MNSSTENRILILAPTGNDGRNVSAVLTEAKLYPVICQSLQQLCEHFRKGACALLVAQESLTKIDSQELASALGEQEPWSDIPFIIVTNGPRTTLSDVDRVFGERVNLSLIERPFSRATLISAIRSAVRARKRQYEVRELLRDVVLAREDAVAANRMKDNFLATVSHELRNPLNGILGFSQLLRRSNKSPEEFQRGLDVIERNARIQASLIDDLLDISRIVSGNLRLDNSAC